MTSPSQEAIDSLARADHGDPFSILGMHESEGGLTVHAFRPDVAKLEVLEIGGKARTWPASRVTEEGFFEAALSGVS